MKIVGEIGSVTLTKINGQRARIMVGNVAFQKDSVIFRCDSAIQFEKDEITYAYRNVRFNQGDSLLLTGDELVFDDANEKAVITGKKVVMTDKKMTLTTTKLHYDMANNIAYYLDSAYIRDKENTIHSIIGYYYANSRNLYFKKRVKLKNVDYTVDTDTLHYNVGTENAYFLGPTHIHTRQGEYLYCERGNFFTTTNSAELGKNSRIETETQVLSGDSLSYNSRTGIGIAHKRARMTDTLQDIEVEGNYGWYKRYEDAFMVTDSVLFSRFMPDDTLFLTADTMRMQYDSARTNQISKAYYHVKVYSTAYQATCDSVYYNSSDSIMHFNGSPVFWMEDFQIQAASIEAQLRNNALYRVFLRRTAVMGRNIDKIHFDQIASDSMNCYFNDGVLQRVDAFVEPKAIYYAIDDKDSSFIGVNQTSGVSASIYFRKGDLNKLNFAQNARANMSPASEIDAKKLVLNGFTWLGEMRPQSVNTLFTVNPKPKPLPDERDSSLQK